MALGDRINELRKEKGISIDELCIRSGIPKGTLSKITAGITANPTLDTVKALAKALECRLDDFDDEPKHKDSLSKEALNLAKKYDALDEHGKKAINAIMDIELERKPTIHEAKEDNIIRLPFSDYKASAGTGAFLFNGYSDNTIDVILNSITERASECIAVSGDSMQPLYYDGDILLVKRQPNIEVGEIGIFIKGGQGYVKKKGEDRLISLNKEYKDIYPDDEVITCYGKVIGKVEDEWRR